MNSRDSRALSLLGPVSSGEASDVLIIPHTDGAFPYTVEPIANVPEEMGAPTKGSFRLTRTAGGGEQSDKPVTRQTF